MNEQEEVEVRGEKKRFGPWVEKKGDVEEELFEAPIEQSGDGKTHLNDKFGY